MRKFFRMFRSKQALKLVYLLIDVYLIENMIYFCEFKFIKEEMAILKKNHFKICF